MTDQTRTEPLDRLADDFHAADIAASLVHDYIWQKPVLSGTEPPSQQQASDAVWAIHRVLRDPSLIAEAREAARLRSAAEALVDDGYDHPDGCECDHHNALRAALVKP